MKKTLFIIVVFLSSLSFAQEGYRLKTNMYRDILSFVLKASDIDAIGNGLERVGYKLINNTTSNDGSYYSKEYDMSDGEKLIISRYSSTGSVYKIYLIHQTNIFNFVIDFLDNNANVYKPNQVWYNKYKNVGITYSIEDNTVAILQILKL